LIGTDEEHAVTILEGNHRLTAAMLASPKLLQRQFRVLCGFSPHMGQCCWYQTNFTTLWRYFKNRISNLHDKDADVARLLQLQSWRVASPVTAEKISSGEISPDAILDSK